MIMGCPSYCAISRACNCPLSTRLKAIVAADPEFFRAHEISTQAFDDAHSVG
jgi:hypothetical protein